MASGPAAGRPSVRRRQRVGRLRKTACWGLLLATFTTVAVPGPVWGQPQGVRQIGVLPTPKGGVQGDVATELVAVDSSSRRMYGTAASGIAANSTVIAEYDLTKRVPTVRRQAVVKWTFGGPKTRVAIDQARHRLFYLDFQGEDECAACSFLRVFNIQTFEVEVSYNLTLLIPNFYADGMTFSAPDGLLYLTGSSAGAPTYYAETTAGAPFYPQSIAAFDPDEGMAVWWKVVPQCLHAMAAQSRGALIARSAYENALYIVCVRPDYGGDLNGPGQSGLLRLRFAPRANLQSAASFPVEFFPISGTYTTGEGVRGLAEYDPIADRFYILSQAARTPGVWVFDGRDSAWVGFIATVSPNNISMGVDPGSGHVYVRSGSQPSGMIVTDGRSTPVAQGREFPFEVFGSSIETDPPTRRVFISVYDLVQQFRTLVLLDETESAPPRMQTDYDGLTTDVAEGPSTEATYSGSLSGFGSRVVLVGGTGGVVASTGSALQLTIPPVWDRGYLLGLPPGDRGTFFGHVGSVDVRNSGAAASAQAITPDSTTANDYTNKQDETFKQLGDSAPEVQPWRWPAAVCVDGEGKPEAQDKSDTGTVAKASCDLKNAKADARSAAGDVVPADGISIGSSSFDGSAVRTPVEGIVTTATAVARDIRITVPGAGSLTIGRIRAAARSIAHGRRGTASVQWSRDIDHVAIIDASGKPVFSCASQCDTSAIEDAVRQWAGIKIAIKFPTPMTRATPGGAFAGVQKTDGAYYDGFTVNNDDTFSAPAAEILVYNDYGERSRLLIQLAAIQASSIYGISVVPPDSFQPPGLPALPPPVGDLLGPSVPLPPPVAAPPPAQDSSVLERLIRSSRFLIRSPGDALLIGLIATLSLGAVAACWRRRSLLGLLDDFGSGG